MLNQKLKLNTKILNTKKEDLELVSTRTGFGDGLVLAAQKNKNVVGLCADLTDSTQMKKFAEKFPERFIQVGVAEQNLVTVASGMAAMGKIPFASSYAVFNPGRNWEQIRTTICINNRPVKIVGSHAGVSVGPDGSTHEALEDIAMMRVLPNMQVFSPCDALEAKKITEAIAKTDKPSYLRLYRNNTPIITTEETHFEIGKAQIFYDPPMKAKIVMIATGPVIFNAICAAQKFAEKGIAIKVVNVSTIKPLDEKIILELAKESGKVVTVEDHQIVGGLGSSVAELLAKNLPTKMEFIGVKDQFGQSGTPEELEKYYGLDTESIISVLYKILENK